MDTFDFEASLPTWKVPTTVSAIPLLSYKPMSEEVRYTLRKIPGLGTKVCYEGPGDQEFIMGVRIENTVWDDFFEDYKELMAIKGCTGTLDINGDPTESHVRTDESHDDCLIESVAPSEEPVSGVDGFSMRFIILVKKLRIVD